MKPVILPREARRRVIEHVRQSLPKEAVGLLAGSAVGQVELVVPLSNIANGMHDFLADPFEQYRALQRIKAMKLNLLAIYHSHPDGGHTPSAHDLKYAQAWDCWHLIVPVDASGRVPEKLEAFRCGSHGSERDPQNNLA
jgi:proteasome lid subunit RPN8/RPN11